MVPILLWPAAALLLLYLLALGTLFAAQRLFYYPAPRDAAAMPIGPPPGFEDVRLSTSDGLSLRAFHHPAAPGMPSLIFFHGNGDSLAGSLAATRSLAGRGYGILLPEYRGYGGNPGTPSEQGLYRDGSAALRWLLAHDVPPARIVAIGNSLGSGVATEMAAKNRIGGLILVSGFASLVRVVGQHFPFVPASLLVTDRYENAAKLKDMTCPVLILHGTADTVAPVDNARALARALPAATLEIIPGVGHELAYLEVAQDRIAAWLKTRFSAVAPASDVVPPLAQPGARSA